MLDDQGTRDRSGHSAGVRSTAAALQRRILAGQDARLALQSRSSWSDEPYIRMATSCSVSPSSTEVNADRCPVLTGAGPETWLTCLSCGLLDRTRGRGCHLDRGRARSIGGLYRRYGRRLGKAPAGWLAPGPRQEKPGDADRMCSTAASPFSPAPLDYLLRPLIDYLRRIGALGSWGGRGRRGLTARWSRDARACHARRARSRTSKRSARSRSCSG